MMPWPDRALNSHGVNFSFIKIGKGHFCMRVFTRYMLYSI